MTAPRSTRALPANSPSQERKIDTLKNRIAEAEQSLLAIRQDEMEAKIVNGADGSRVRALRKADCRYRQLVERMQEGAVTLSPDGIVLYANRRLAAFLGCTVHDIMGKWFGTFIAAADQDLFAQLMLEAGQGGGRDELELCPANGTAVPVYLSVVDPQGGGERIISGIITDLRWQKQRLRELAEMNSRLVDAMARTERAERRLWQTLKLLDSGMQVDAAMSGVMMHDGMTGFQLAQALRHQLPDLAINLVSALTGGPGDVDKAAQRGADPSQAV